MIMLKQNATWEQIQIAWSDLSHKEKVTVAARFNRNLKKYRPDIHAKLIKSKQLKPGD